MQYWWDLPRNIHTTCLHLLPALCTGGASPSPDGVSTGERGGGIGEDSCLPAGLTNRGRWLPETLQWRRILWNIAKEEESLKHCKGWGLPETLQRMRTPWNIAKEDDSLKHCRGRWLPKRGRWLPKTLQRKMTPWNIAEENSLKYCTGRWLPKTQQRKILPKTLRVQEMTLYTSQLDINPCVIVVGVVIPLTKCVDSGEILCVQPFLWMSTWVPLATGPCHWTWDL